MPTKQDVEMLRAALVEAKMARVFVRSSVYAAASTVGRQMHVLQAALDDVRQAGEKLIEIEARLDEMVKKMEDEG